MFAVVRVFSPARNHRPCDYELAVVPWPCQLGSVQLVDGPFALKVEADRALLRRHGAL